MSKGKALGVAKDEAREVGKGWSTEDGELHLVDICFLLSFISTCTLNLLKKRSLVYFFHLTVALLYFSLRTFCD